jgi:hypothetical protein
MHWQTVDDIKDYLESKFGFKNLGEENPGLEDAKYLYLPSNDYKSFMYKTYHILIRSLIISNKKLEVEHVRILRNYIDLLVPNIAKEIFESENFEFFASHPAGLLFYLLNSKLESKSYTCNTYRFVVDEKYYKQPSKTRRSIILEKSDKDSIVNRIITEKCFKIAENQDSRISFVPYCMEMCMSTLFENESLKGNKIRLFFRGAKTLVPKSSKTISPVKEDYSKLLESKLHEP